MDIKNLQKKWNSLGKNDLLWAILTIPAKKGNRWSKEEFFETGVKEINAVLDYVRSLGVALSWGKALDFGCGVGRLSQALSCHFSEVKGVDISTAMIDLARQYNEFTDQCKYFVNDTEDLSQLPDNYFDFIYSNITLQHIYPSYSRNYIQEFIRVLAPEGILVFQLPERRNDKFRSFIRRMAPEILIELYSRLSYSGKMEMYGMDRAEIKTLLINKEAEIIDVKQEQDAGKEWLSFRYCVTK
ncbi:MAG: class I SAM-dependent methyltransferase [Thermodesulfovibrionales bacterium]